MPTFDTLESIYQLTSPSDLDGNLRLRLGANTTTLDYAELLHKLITSEGLGCQSSDVLKKKIEELSTSASGDAKKKINSLITCANFEGLVSTGDASYWSNNPKLGTALLLGDSWSAVSQYETYKNQEFSVVALRTPYIHPSKRYTNKVDMFLNNMPPVMLNMMVPYLDVQFQVVRRPGPEAAGPGLYKFLMGSSEPEETPDKVLVQANQSSEKSTKSGEKYEYEYAGMEMFTSPQTLVNMRGLSAEKGYRYVDVNDPFRPFASVESVEITVTPAVGTYTYKKAQLKLKLHDRSRLSEFSDLIRPKGYKDVKIWLTYGWLAPQIPNEYFSYINNNMLVRECYKIVNSSFTFDTVGQLQVSVELYTQGAFEMMTTPVTEGPEFPEHAELRKLCEEIEELRKKTLKDEPEGLGKDIRIYQVLNSAAAMEWPDMKPSELNKVIDQFRAKLSKLKNVDNDKVNELLDKLKKFAKPSKDDKFEFKQKYENAVNARMNSMLSDAMKGDDPFVPRSPLDEDTESAFAYFDEELVSSVKNYVKGISLSKEEAKKANDEKKKKITAAEESNNKKNLRKSINQKKKEEPVIGDRKVVSFGKLFSKFIAPPLLSTKKMDELQIVFYALNEQCGPSSLHSIAEFPVDMAMFIDHYKQHVMKQGSEQMTVGEFVNLIIGSQFYDNRAIGYGLRQYFEPYDVNNKEAKIKPSLEQEYEAHVSAQITKYGGFKKPSIAVYVETLHKNNKVHSIAGKSLYDIMNSTAKTDDDANDVDVTSDSELNSVIMRIHVYDKQLTPFLPQLKLMRDNDTDDFYKFDTQSKLVSKRMSSQPWFEAIKDTLKDVITAPGTKAKGSKNIARDQLAASIPKIVYGSNGSTILNASLSSKQDALLSTVNMQKNERIRNTITPNGSGDYGLPMRVVPASLTMTTLGCPLACMAQNYYIDFGTGTTLDNLYIVTNLSHHISPGKFETSWTFGYADAYGKYYSAPTIAQAIKDVGKSQLTAQKLLC